MSSFVYYTHVKFVFKEASEQLLQDNMSDNVHLGEFYACYIFFFFFFLSLTVLIPLSPCSGVLREFKKSTCFFFWNVVDNQSQAGSSPCGGWEPCGLTYKTFIFIYWKFKLGGLFIHMFVAAQVYTHTFLYYTQNTPRALIPLFLFFFPRWGCQPCGNDALTNKIYNIYECGNATHCNKSTIWNAECLCMFY